ncbi:TraG family conjugative transposon ATPase [Mucilaginibacter sp. BJC16-A38]|uniref:TraG family conjugative transposon ATPase n=1 Tax=Mucilaginibacter phenanthrenivorans TaxID=1234842 RepID=UPI0021588776|nr:TraG family conjugative transposon ATPase [Mucilaginibacter phenanthrenivorans]MCR8556946.1 TraG family conjugative transposon ATPase [Mucilaginibacter phenanthrenivorans]
MVSIENILPIYKVEHNCILSRQGDITIGYELSLPELFTRSAQDYEAGHQALVKAVKLLSPLTVVHQQDVFMQRDYAGSLGAAQSFLSLSGERYFQGRPYLDHRCYLYLTKKPDGRKAASSGYSTLMRKSPVPAQSLDVALYREFMEKAGAFERIISDSGIGLVRLTDEDLAGTKHKAGVIESYCFLQGRNELPVIKDVHLKDGVRIGDAVGQLFTLADVEDLPALCGSRVDYEPYCTDKTRFSTGFASPLGLLLDCNHIVNQYIFVEDAGKTLKLLEKKRLRLQSLSGYSRENAIARDATSDFLNEAISEQRLPVKAHVNVFAWTNDPDGVQEIKNKVSAAMARLDATAKLETDGAAQIWWAGLPGNAGDFPANDTFDTFLEQATCFFNPDSNYRSDATGIRFGERLYGRPIMVDLFDRPMKNGTITNRNLFVCGGSGGGKSMAMNHILRTLYDQGTHCVTIDIGGSYKGLCKLVGGYYFVYTEANPIRFNPFYLGKGEVLDTEKKESLKTLLIALWKKEDETYSRSEYVAISNAITLYYVHLAKNPLIFPGFNSFYDFLMQEYLEVLENGKVKERDFDIANLLYVLNPYYMGGEFDYLLNATKNLDMLNERFIVFELDNVKNHPILFPVVTLVIMELFISKMRKLPGQRKILAIDEAWIAITKAGMSSFIKYLYKTVRKFNGIAALITQEVDDLISSPILKETVINNADTKVLLDMRKFMNKFEALQAVLGLSDKAKALQLSVNKANEPGRNYREVFIDQGGQVMRVYRNELSVEEYLAYTTEESEKLKVEEYAERYGNMEKGIRALAEELRAKTNKN